MIKITLTSLVKILVDEGEKFVIEKSPEYIFWHFTNKCDVIKFIVGCGYPTGQPCNGSQEHEQNCRLDKYSTKNAVVAMHYDIISQKILCCCERWYKIIEKKVANNVQEKICQEVSSNTKNDVATCSFINEEDN